MNAPISGAGRLIKHSTIYAIGNISRQLVGFLMLPIYTRFLTPTDYGVVGLLTLAMSLMEPLFGARLGGAMPKFFFQETDPKRRNAVVSTALAITGSVSTITVFVLFSVQDATSRVLFGSDEFGTIVGLFGILILTQAVEYYGMTYLRILQRPIAFITVSLLKLAVQLTLNIALVVWMELGVMGVVISTVTSSSLLALGLAGFILYRTGARFDLGLGKAMLSFSWPLWFAGLASLYIYSSNRYYIRIFGSLDEVGLYELATKFASIGFFLVWTPFNQFWETERFNHYRQQPQSPVFAQTFSMISFVLVFVSVVTGILAGPVIQIMADPEFHRANAAVPMLIGAFLFSNFANFVTFSLMVTSKTRLVSLIGYLTVAVITVLNLALIPTFGFIGAAFALVGAMLFQFFLSLYWGRRHFDMKINVAPVIMFAAFLTLSFLASTFVFRSDRILMDIAAKLLLLGLCLGALLWFAFQNPLWRTQALTAWGLVATRLGRNRAT